MAYTGLGFGILASAGGVLALAAVTACGGSSSDGPKGDGGAPVVAAEGGDVGMSSRPKTVGDAETLSDAPSVAIDAGGDAPKIEQVDAGFPGPFPAMPQVINATPGTSAILVNPKIVAIFFSNDDPATITRYGSFYSGIGATAYWKALAEYGIGAPTVQNVTLTEAGPATIDDTYDGSNTALESWLLSEITSGTLPPTDANTEYIINFPAGTTITQDGDSSCQVWDGYHSDMADTNNKLIAYAVVPRCPAGGGFTVDQTFSTTASHELIEGATDPWPDYTPGWLQADNADLFFDEANSGSEIGDMCQDDPEANFTFSDLPFMVQRFWSNAAANAGHDPCVPAYPNETFFNAVPVVSDKIPFAYDGNTVATKGVTIPVGGSATIMLDLYSDAKTAPWTVQVFDYNWYFFSTSSSMSDALLSFDAASSKGITGNNGDKIPVTITVKTAGSESTNQEVKNTELYVIQAVQGTAQDAPYHLWYGIVGQ